MVPRQMQHSTANRSGGRIGASSVVWRHRGYGEGHGIFSNQIPQMEGNSSRPADQMPPQDGAAQQTPLPTPAP
eukprot:scaffold965_cov344-Prasinococcus_capsulatus_cf.AAC.4